MSRPALAAPSRTWGWAAVPAGARWSSTPRASRWWRPAAVWAAAGAPPSAPTAPSPLGEDRKASIDWDKCVGCGRCIAVCNTDAIRPGNDAAMEELGCRMAEYAKAVVDGRPQFHISLVIDVSPYCDCHGENDLPIVPDVGMFASFDPVALDQACARRPAGNSPPSLAPTWTSRCTGRASATSTTTSSTVCRTPTGGCAWPTVRKSASGTRSYELVEVK